MSIFFLPVNLFKYVVVNILFLKKLGHAYCSSPDGKSKSVHI